MSQAQIKTTDHQKLRSDLRKLQGELRVVKSVNPEEQRMLRLLESDIEAVLGRDDLRPDPNAQQRLSETLARVEAAHPRVMLLTRQMVDSLAYLGI